VPASAARVTTGVPGLDRVLGGGLPAGGLYILQGTPGAGKTTLANQLAFAHAKAPGAGTVVYLTLLAESHERLLANLRTMTFFDEHALGSRIAYVSAFSVLESKGLDGLLELLRRELRRRGARILVLDGLGAIEDSAKSPREVKRFVQAVQVQAGLLGFTGVLVTSVPTKLGTRSEHTMVDGIIELSDKTFGNVAVRQLEVKKLRGSAYHRGLHTFSITDDGVQVFPRIESLLQFPSKFDASIGRRTKTGIGQLDTMLHGGLPSGSTTMLVGPSGAGKTVFGLHYLSRSTAKEPGLLFSFYETPARLLDKANKIGVDLRALVEKGHVEIEWEPPIERLLDDLGDRLLTAVRRRRVKRLFIDGLGGFAASAVHPERLPAFFTALANELRARDVTTVYTVESRNIVGREIEAPLTGISTIVENLFVLRFIEVGAQLHRLLSIVKVRDSKYECDVRELRIGPSGIDIARTFASADEILTVPALPTTVAAMTTQSRQRR